MIRVGKKTDEKKSFALFNFRNFRLTINPHGYWAEWLKFWLKFLKFLKFS